MAIGKWLEGYSGQRVDELLALAPEYRVDSIVVAIEGALLGRPGAGLDGLNQVEADVVVVEAYEREVNNGGHHQFFLNTPEYAPHIVGALTRIACPFAAQLAAEAIRMLNVHGDLTRENIERALDEGGESLPEEMVQACDNPFYDGVEPIADRLFEYLKANASRLRLP